MRKRTLSFWLLAAATAGLLCSAPGVQAEESMGGMMMPTATMATTAPLDGKTFVINSDELIFKDGTFRSISCDPFGFTAVPYTYRIDGETIYFAATATSPKSGSMYWTGSVTGKEIEANYLWYKNAWFWTRSKEMSGAGTLK